MSTLYYTNGYTNEIKHAKKNPQKPLGFYYYNNSLFCSLFRLKERCPRSTIIEE